MTMIKKDSLMENNVFKILAGVVKIRKDFEEKWLKTGEKYNLFKVADISHKEVIMCRVLADLLNPQGKHCQGNRYLNEFWKTISPKLPSTIDLIIEKTKVKAEYVIDENRRIDITLEDGRIFLPIEVKISAGDQPKQIKDYYEFSKKKNNINVPVLYLTIYGHEPSAFSKKDVGKDDYVTLSFNEDILKWLDACVRGNTSKTTVPVQENLRQFIAAIKSLCGKSEDAEMENEILKFITKDDDSVRAALAICGVMDFDNRAREAFKNNITPLVQNAFPNAVYNINDGWYMIQVNIMDGNYILDVNYDWKSFYIEVCVDDKERNHQIEDCMIKEMVTLTNQKNEVKDGIFALWGTNRYPFKELVDDDLYYYKLYKLYTEHSQEAADKIIEMAKALEGTKV